MPQKIKVVKKITKYGQRRSVMSLVWSWYGIWKFHVGTLVFALYFNFRISIVEIKIKIRTYFRLLVSNTTQEHGGWKQPEGNDELL